MPDQEKIRVLLVDDIADAREQIRRLIQFDPNIEVIGDARNGKEAIELSVKLKPDVVIMDVNMPDMDGIAATEIIREKVPYVQVIFLTVQTDNNYMRRAMNVGARDFLSKPPSFDELINAIRRAGLNAKNELTKITQVYGTGPLSSTGSMPVLGSQSGKIIVLYSPKGGTGCTTLATNLALALKDGNNRVLLVDANVQFGDVAVFLNEQVRNTILDLTSRVDDLDEDVVEEVVSKHAASGISILAAPQRPEMAEKVNCEQFSKTLQYLRNTYNYIVVDTASYLTDVVQGAIESADLIILVTTQDIPAIKNANAFLMLADASSISREKILFVMNHYDRRIAITPERISENLRQPILVTIPFEERVVTSAINRGVPLLLENRTCLVSKGIFALADASRERLAKLDTQPAAALKESIR